MVAGRDKVAVDGQSIHDERPAYIAVNKPKGYVSTNNDPSGRPRVVDLVPDIPQRVYTVGRLDEMSTGLMLLTNDGELANKLAHPKFGVEKIYRAVVAGTPEPEVYQKLVEGVWLAEGKVRAKRVKPIAHKGDATVMEMVLAEGKNREVRRMLAKLGHKVMTLTRVAVGPITLKGLKPGGWRFLTGSEVDLLRKVADGMPVPSARFGSDRPMRAPTRGPRAEKYPQPSRPESRPGGDRRPSFQPSGPSPRPRLAQLGEDRNDRPSGEGRRPSGPRPGASSTSRPAMGQNSGDRPRPAPRQNMSPPPRAPFQPRPQARPPQDVVPSRKIIGLNLPRGRDSGAGDLRHSPRRRPQGAPLRPRPLAPRRRRPGEGDESSE